MFACIIVYINNYNIQSHSSSFLKVGVEVGGQTHPKNLNKQKEFHLLHAPKQVEGGNTLIIRLYIIM